jgi:ankyrin repeat protein
VTSVYARLIAGRQNPSGDWDSFQDRPPSSYSRFTHTAVAPRAIELYSHPSQQADLEARVVRAREWLSSHTPGDTEERTYRLFGLWWAHSDHAALSQAARDLAATQQSDGGWNSLDGRPSDAYSTSEALVALNDAGGVSTSEPSWKRGLKFLLDTQAADGSWHAATRLFGPVSPPYFESGYPYGHDQFLSASAASWAVIAMARALGPAHQQSPAARREAEPSGMEPWAETVLFGSADELKHLLAGGFDPNSATATGHTTALMMAAPDLEKVTLLLDHGAKVNERAKTKYSALMVAAQYREASPVIRLLLARGAEVRLPPGQGAPPFNAHPLFLAAFAGNAEILRTLRDAGDKLDEFTLVAGVAETTPLQGAEEFGNVEVIAALLALGAPVDQAGEDGITALDHAVLSNEIDVARLLIRSGANVNHADSFGMTPLLWAASVDFGDSAMLDLLLKSGAHADARSKQGLAAIDLAHKYGHTHLFASLSPKQ